MKVESKGPRTLFVHLNDLSMLLSFSCWIWFVSPSMGFTISLHFRDNSLLLF